MGRGVGAGPSADQPMPPVDRDVVLVAEGRHRETGLRRPVLTRSGFAKLHRPAFVAVLLAQFGGLFPSGLGDLPGAERSPHASGVTLLRGRHDRRIDDLSAHRQTAAGPQRRVEARK